MRMASIGARGSLEFELLEGGEGGERRGQRRAAFGADVVLAATKRGERWGGKRGLFGVGGVIRGQREAPPTGPRSL